MTANQLHTKLSVVKVIKVQALRHDHELCIKAAKKTYNQHLKESKQRNKRIFNRYGALVYKSEFDQLYGKDGV